MFISLLIVTFVIAAATSFAVAYFFQRPVAVILTRIIADELALAWQRYVVFGMYLVGITGGVRIWQLERYVSPAGRDQPLALNTDRWALEIYRTLVGSLESIATALLVFFIVALFAYLVVRSIERRAVTAAS